MLCLITGDVSLGHVDKVLTASSLRCGVPLFPFAINKNLPGGAGRSFQGFANTFFLLTFLRTNFSTRLQIPPAAAPAAFSWRVSVLSPLPIYRRGFSSKEAPSFLPRIRIHSMTFSSA